MSYFERHLQPDFLVTFLRTALHVFHAVSKLNLIDLTARIAPDLQCSGVFPPEVQWWTERRHCSSACHEPLSHLH